LPIGGHTDISFRNWEIGKLYSIQKGENQIL